MYINAQEKKYTIKELMSTIILLITKKHLKHHKLLGWLCKMVPLWHKFTIQMVGRKRLRKKGRKCILILPVYTLIYSFYTIFIFQCRIATAINIMNNSLLCLPSILEVPYGHNKLLSFTFYLCKFETHFWVSLL